MKDIRNYQQVVDRVKIVLIFIMMFFGNLPLFIVTAVFIALILMVKIAVNHQYPKKLRLVLIATHLFILVIQIYFFVFTWIPVFQWQGLPIRFLTTSVLLVPFLVEFFVVRSNNDRFYLPTFDEVTTISFSELKANQEKIQEALTTAHRVRHVLTIQNIKALLSDIHRHSVARYINEGSLSADYLKRADETLNDPYLYIVISNTGSPASELISLFTQKQFNHASLSFDAELTTIISYNGGENIYPPGLNAEMIASFHKKTDATVLIYRLPITTFQKAQILATVREINLTGSAYNLMGLVTKHSLRHNMMFCSQFVYKMLQVANIAYFDKNPGDVRPTDFIELDYRRKLEFVTENKF